MNIKKTKSNSKPNFSESKNLTKIRNNENVALITKPFHATLPRLEIFAYFLVWIGHSVFAFYKVYHASVTFEHSLTTVHRGTDMADYEWVLWPRLAWKMIFWMLGHNLVFNFYSANERRNQIFILFYSFFGHVILYGWYTVMVTVAAGLLMFSVAALLRNTYSIWAISALLLIYSEQIFKIFSPSSVQDDLSHFMTLTLFAYKMVQYLSYCIDTLSEKSKTKNDKSRLFTKIFDMFFYAFYFPYTTMLIVVYDDFRRQLEERRRKSLFFISCFACRVMFWLIFNDAFLRHFYVNSFMENSEILNKTDDCTVLSVAYLSGQFFHAKYTAIFGFHSMFAHVDGMQPPKPPICISRVSLYSRMWRSFDIGLYSFIKKYIYLPMIKGYTGLWTIFALIVSYTFVIAWHGARRRYIYWITLNFIELLLERFAYVVYRKSTVNSWITGNFSARNIRRLSAVLQNVCVAFGIFGVLYFLGAEGTGDYLSRKIWWEEGVKFDRRFWHVFLLGYCFNQCCMEIERYELEKGKREATENLSSI